MYEKVAQNTTTGFMIQLRFIARFDMRAEKRQNIPHNESAGVVSNPMLNRSFNSLSKQFSNLRHSLDTVGLQYLRQGGRGIQVTKLQMKLAILGWNQCPKICFLPLQGREKVYFHFFILQMKSSCFEQWVRRHGDHDAHDDPVSSHEMNCNNWCGFNVDRELSTGVTPDNNTFLRATVYIYIYIHILIPRRGYPA